MEAREEVDSATDASYLKKLFDENKQRQDELVRQMSAAFAASDIAEVQHLTVRLTYLDTLEKSIIDKM